MELTAGAELVWTLAASEAATAQMAEIEPEHLFCAVLKLADLRDEDFSALGTDMAKQVLAERERVRGILRERALPATAARRRLRQVLGLGNQPYQKGQVLHRSSASRRIFEQAANLAARGPLEANHLLSALLAEPGERIRHVMGEMNARMEGGGAAPNPQHWRELPAGAQTLPTRYQAQARVLAAALNAIQTTPLVLVCAPEVDPQAVLDAALHLQDPRPSTWELAGELTGREGRTAESTDWWLRVLGELGGPDGASKSVAYIEAREVSERVCVALFTALGRPAGELPRLVVVVAEERYHATVEPLPSLEGAYRLIWLHALTSGTPPTHL